MTTTKDYVELVHRHTPADAVIGFTTIAGTYVQTRFYKREYLDRLLADIDAVGQRMNAYMRLTPLERPPAKGRGLERQSLGASVLWVDYDAYANQVKGLEHLRARPLPPTMIVSSGNGLHAYWALDRFETDIDAIKARNKRLVREINSISPEQADQVADSCYDLARVLRIPGTWNVKKDPPLLCEVLEYHPDRVYHLADFSEDPLEDTSILVWDAEPLPADFGESLREKDRKLWQRITTEEGAKKQEAPAGPDGRIDRSRNDAFICTKLLAHGYPAAQLFGVLMHPDWFSGAKYRETARYDYAVRTINNAYRAYVESPDRYFIKTSFQARKLADELTTASRYMYSGELIWSYRGGVYHRDGEYLIRNEITKRLGDRWQSRHADEAVTWIKDTCKVDVKALNDHKGSINCLNGMLNAVTGELLPHDPRYSSTVQIPSEWDPNADCTQVDAFIADILPHDAIPMFWEYVGAAFLADHYWPKAFICLVGQGDSGKSKVLEALMRFYGNETNVSALSLQTLADRQFASAELFGKLANIFSDLDEAEAQNTGQIKSLTGDDYISGEQKFKSFFVFRNTARLWFSANNYPAVRNPDDAYFLRAKIIPCTNKFAAGDPRTDPFIVDKVTTPPNMSAWLRRAAEGLARLLDQNMLTPSASVDAASEVYRFTADTVSGYLHACEYDPEYSIPKSAMYRLYVNACTAAGRTRVSEDKFFKRVADALPRFGMSESYRQMPDGSRAWVYTGRRPRPRLEVVEQPQMLMLGSS